MKTNSVLQVRIDADIRNQAEDLFARLGITTTDAVRMFLMKSLESDGFPFELRTGFSAHRVLHASGIASKYADISKIPEEKTAWEKAVIEKYGHS